MIPKAHDAEGTSFLKIYSDFFFFFLNYLSDETNNVLRNNLPEWKKYFLFWKTKLPLEKTKTSTCRHSDPAIFVWMHPCEENKDDCEEFMVDASCGCPKYAN